jgi:hypothetical protein
MKGRPMTKPLDPEIKALRAMDRAYDTLPENARQRCLEWFVASRLRVPAFRLPRTPVTKEKPA